MSSLPGICKNKKAWQVKCVISEETIAAMQRKHAETGMTVAQMIAAAFPTETTETMECDTAICLPASIPVQTDTTVCACNVHCPATVVTVESAAAAKPQRTFASGSEKKRTAMGNLTKSAIEKKTKRMQEHAITSEHSPMPAGTYGVTALPAYRKSFYDVIPKVQSQRMTDAVLVLQAALKDAGEDLELGDCLALHQLSQAKDVSIFLLKSPQMVKVHNMWQSEAIDEYKTTLSMSGDEALFLKDKMMSSYAAWDVMRKVSGADEVWPGAHQIKALAKTYNAYLMTTLGFEKTDDKVGYKLDCRKVSEWIIEQQVLAGLPRWKIPKVIKYKLSLDGSMMGNRDVELVAIVPLNLGISAQSMHAVYPIALYEGKEKRSELEKDLGWIAPQLRSMEQKSARRQQAGCTRVSSCYALTFSHWRRLCAGEMEQAAAHAARDRGATNLGGTIMPCACGSQFRTRAYL